MALNRGWGLKRTSQAIIPAVSKARASRIALHRQLRPLGPGLGDIGGGPATLTTPPSSPITARPRTWTQLTGP